MDNRLQIDNNSQLNELYPARSSVWDAFQASITIIFMPPFLSHAAKLGRTRIGPFYQAHKVLIYIEYRAVSGVFRTINPPPPFHPASVSSPRTKGGTHSLGGEGVGGQYFGRRQTLDKPLRV
jgi:hypothetical protein